MCEYTEGYLQFHHCFNGQQFAEVCNVDSMLLSVNTEMLPGTTTAQGILSTVHTLHSAGGKVVVCLNFVHYENLYGTNPTSDEPR